VKKLRDKVALITGGTSGIGAATAKLFQGEGAKVIVTGSNPTTLEAARVSMPGIDVIASEASDVIAIRALIDGIKPITVGLTCCLLTRPSPGSAQFRWWTSRFSTLCSTSTPEALTS
jgi:NAD(P)-dependent dehydrogenase (short-subunit alcohol dehydrogenase family)